MFENSLLLFLLLFNAKIIHCLGFDSVLKKKVEKDRDI